MIIKGQERDIDLFEPDILGQIWDIKGNLGTRGKKKKTAKGEKFYKQS